jgi:hypothetical protein
MDAEWRVELGGYGGEARLGWMTGDSGPAGESEGEQQQQQEDGGHVPFASRAEHKQQVASRK